MARPRKGRRVCCLPRQHRFGALDPAQRSPAQVVMTVEEYETIRLIDGEGMTQEACARTMAVGRTTVQGMYDSARRKMAKLLVEGSDLLIEGGAFQVTGQCRGACGRLKPRQSVPMGVRRSKEDEADADTDTAGK